MRPDQASFIGIGAQKCASTWLYNVLQQMPEVRLSAAKELDFFSYYFDRGYEWYERHFASERPAMHRGEISPSYFIDADTPARVARYNPGMKIIATLRDPVSRAFSNHTHEVKKQHVSGANLKFETALENNPLYREQGRYATHLARWHDHFPAENILVLFQEEIHSAPAAEAARVAKFLGLAEVEDFVARRANESVVYRNAAIGESLWRVGAFARRHGLGRIVETVKSAPGISTLREANRKDVKEMIDPMEPATERALAEFYAPEVEALSRLIGRTPPWSRFAAPQTEAMAG